MILMRLDTPFVKGMPLLLIYTWWMMSKVGPKFDRVAVFGAFVPESCRRSRLRVKHLISCGDLFGGLNVFFPCLSCLGSEAIDDGITPLLNSDNATRIHKSAAREFLLLGEYVKVYGCGSGSIFELVDLRRKGAFPTLRC